MSITRNRQKKTMTDGSRLTSCEQETENKKEGEKILSFGL